MKILILSSYDDRYKELGDITSVTKINYAKINGYECFIKRSGFNLKRPLSWDKIETCLDLFDQYEAILWTDADAFITNDKIRIEDILNKKESLKTISINHFASDHIDINPPVPIDPCLFITADVHGPCFGTFLIKTDTYLKHLFELIYSQEQFIDDPWWEQRAFHRLVYNKKVDLSRICFLPQNVMNSYWTNYQKGDFVLHMAATLHQHRMLLISNFLRTGEISLR